MPPGWRGQRSQIGGSLATMHWTDEPVQQNKTVAAETSKFTWTVKILDIIATSSLLAGSKHSGPRAMR